MKPCRFNGSNTFVTTVLSRFAWILSLRFSFRAILWRFSGIDGKLLFRINFLKNICADGGSEYRSSLTQSKFPIFKLWTKSSPRMVLNITKYSRARTAPSLWRRGFFDQKIVLKRRLDQLTYNRYKSDFIPSIKNAGYCVFRRICFSDLKVWQMMEYVSIWSGVSPAFGPAAKSSDKQNDAADIGLI